MIAERPPSASSSRPETFLNDPRHISVDPKHAAIGRLGFAFCEKNIVNPVSLIDGHLTVEHTEDSSHANRMIRRQAGANIRVTIHKRDPGPLLKDIAVLQGDRKNDNDMTRVRHTINDAFLRGANLNASDIMFEPEIDCAHLRFDCEGIFVHEATFTLDQYEMILSHLGPQTFTRFDKSTGQKGRYTLDADGRKLNLRGASWPRWLMDRTMPKLVYRVLAPYHHMRRLDQLGMRPGDMDTFLNALKAGDAGVLVAGGPGSGKTTTVFAGLVQLGPSQTNVYSIEDPPEIYVPWIWTTELTDNWIHEAAIALTNRLDSKFVFVGETLDQASAIVTMNATLASVPCATTIHASNVVKAIDRAISLKVERDRIARGCTCFVAQTLVNPLCPNCSVEIPTPDAIREQYDQIIGPGHSCPPTIRQRTVTYPDDSDATCDNCMGHGIITPRIALFEVVLSSPKLRDLILQAAGPDDIANAMYSPNHLPMIASGIELLEAGTIDAESFLKIPTPFGTSKTWL